VVADLYTAEGHLGRGGWTWYTGSASWMYRVGLEAILGFHKRGEKLAVEPCIPTTWGEFTLEYRHASSRYTITVKNPDGVNRGRSEVVVDGTTVPDAHIPLVDDGAEHVVSVTMRPAKER
jgi:cyclic beta-1,2-glucan synthetase